MMNLFAQLPENIPAEIFTTLLDANQIRIERIVSRGQSSPDGFWFDQGGPEWVIVVKGAARLQFEGDSCLLEMGPGDFVNIPSHRRHRVDWTTPDEPTVWLAVHYQDEF